MSFAGIPETAPLGPFLKRSLSVHGVLLGAALVAANRGAKEPEQVYRIDFIASSPAIQNRQAPAPPPAAAAPLPAPSYAKPERQKDPDAFNLRKPSFLSRLPRPTFLDAARPDKTPPPLPPVPAPTTAAGTGPSDGLGAVSADMPDFPYPWYLTLLRQKIWDQWSSRMPPETLECLVQFSILRDGSITDVRVEESSGESLFDSAATAAVRGAVPLPPLPPAFKERFLKVHIQFKTR